jgi:hypothetical protein
VRLVDFQPFAEHIIGAPQPALPLPAFIAETRDALAELFGRAFIPVKHPNLREILERIKPFILGTFFDALRIKPYFRPRNVLRHSDVPALDGHIDSVASNVAHRRSPSMSIATDR